MPWSNYYPGFSESFARDVLESFGLTDDEIILDPWNGSGTTTAVAARLGKRSIGIDINPSMAIVARAREVRSDDVRLILARLNELRRLVGEEKQAPTSNRDPLRLWFDESTSQFLRSISELISQDSGSWRSERMETVNSFLFLALSSSVRNWMKDFQSTNPNWVRRPKETDQLVSIDREEVLRQLRCTSSLFLERLAVVRDHPKPASRSQLLVASADNLPLSDGSVSAVLTSPPYCTRIDYAVACQPELAVMGYPFEDKYRMLRDSMLGTSTISRRDMVPNNTQWGETCYRTIKAIENHGSKASSTYYGKTMLQYFAQLYASIGEIARVLKQDGKLVMVLQDSFYKEIRIDLATICREMAESLGLQLIEERDFPAKITMRSMNSRSRAYNSAGVAVESVLKFSKAMC